MVNLNRIPETDMIPRPVEKKHSPAFHMFLMLFTIFAIPIIIALPFLLNGFIGRL